MYLIRINERPDLTDLALPFLSYRFDHANRYRLRHSSQIKR
jgi:hypothetical protein